MSEVELHTLRNRLNRGRDCKAQRGELFYSVPMGYVLLPTGAVDLDPDEQARSVVHLLFEEFDELGSAYALWRWLIRHGIALPIRPRRGPTKGQIEWREPTQVTIRQALHHPIYAGAYAYGRRPIDPRRRDATGRPRRTNWLPIDHWQVLIRDHLPAYITWDRYLNNQERLRQNQTRSETLGTPRGGVALLAGLLVCGRCGWRMQVSYRTRLKPWYRCHHRRMCTSAPDCTGLVAEAIDRVVAQQVLRALEPAALELSLRVKDDLQRERQRLERHWKQRLERARYDADLAERRYRAVDPENRLVAAALERQWGRRSIPGSGRLSCGGGGEE
jgi:hypothetical protein